MDEIRHECNEMAEAAKTCYPIIEIRYSDDSEMWLYITGDHRATHSTPISYCPHCGRKLQSLADWQRNASLTAAAASGELEEDEYAKGTNRRHGNQP